MQLEARPHVHSLAIELTAFCNQHCDYCYNAWREDRGASIGTPELRTLLGRIDRVIDAVDLEHVTLTGGEPLASHDLFPVLDHLRARHVRAQMISNASLVTEAIAQRLSKHRLLSVLVTLNGPDAALHDAQVGGTHFEDTIAGIKRLRKARIAVEGSIVLTRRNAARVAETLALFRSLGVERVALSRFSPAGYSVKLARELTPSPEDVSIALEHGAAAVREHRMRVFSTMTIPPCALDTSRFTEIEFQHCPIGTPRQEFTLGPKGELRHCALHRSPIEGAENVLADGVDVARIFASGDPHRYRAVVPDDCQGCEHVSTCAGGCGAAALWVHGARSKRDPFASWGAPSGPEPRRLPLVG